MVKCNKCGKDCTQDDTYVTVWRCNDPLCDGMTYYQGD